MNPDLTNAFGTLAETIKKRGNTSDDKTWGVAIAGAQWPLRMALRQDPDGAMALSFNGNTIATRYAAGEVVIAEHDPRISSTQRYTPEQSRDALLTHAGLAQTAPDQFKPLRYGAVQYNAV